MLGLFFLVAPSKGHVAYVQLTQVTQNCKQTAVIFSKNVNMQLNFVESLKQQKICKQIADLIMLI